MTAKQRAGRVVVVGSLNADLTVDVGHRPEPGETVLGGDLVVRAGGKGANQAVAAARVGAEVAMIGRVGDDAHAELLREALRAAGVDDHAVEATPGVATGSAQITVTPDGENAIVVAPGANARLTAADVRRHAALLAAAEVVVCQLEIPMEVVEEVAAVIGDGRLVLNAAPAQALPEALLQRIDVLAVNAHELRVVAAAAGAGPAVEGAERDTVLALLDRGPRVVVATLGADGAVVSDAEGSATIRTQPANVVDTTGAGDAAVGALAAALSAGLAAADAVRVAVAAGTAAVGEEGAQPDLPGLDALLGSAVVTLERN